MSGEKTKVLILVEWFWPGYKAGGPIRSVANLIGGLKDHCEFKVITTNEDIGKEGPYPGVPANTWTHSEHGTPVYYFSRKNLSRKNLRRLLEEEEYEVLYINGLFSIYFTLYPLWIVRKLRKRIRVILAPRGMLHPGAMAFKAGKKNFFLSLIRRLKLHKRVMFHATDNQEIMDLRAAFGLKVPLLLAPNLPNFRQPDWKPHPKEAGKLKLLFLSRINEKKNLLLILQILEQMEATVSLDIVGPVHQPDYWSQCEKAIRKLPSHIKVTLKEPVPPEKITGLLENYHFFVLPTLGENFGHSIFEALSAGLPVIISDQTPWRNLENREAGWDIALSKPRKFLKALNDSAAMDQETYNRWSKAAWDYAREFLGRPQLIQDNIRLLCGNRKQEEM